MVDDDMTHFLLVVLAFVMGLLIGSFLNVCVFRLPRDLSVVNPARSFCPGCERTIAWFDNIPLVSYALLKGRCRYCKEWIPVRYPLVELATGVAFAVCAARFGLHAPGVKYAIFAAIMIDLIATDLEERILPDEFTLGGTLVGLVIAAFVPMPIELAHLILPLAHVHLGPVWLSVIESGTAAAFGSGAIWFVAWAYQKMRHREGLGLGDVKMIAMIGSFLGLEAALVTLMVASLLGAVIGFAYILIKKKDAATYELPFGSFLGLAAVLVAVYAETVMRGRLPH
jgi:leader peptidase (prepilin peptidase)/N-methyltransferase